MRETDNRLNHAYERHTTERKSPMLLVCRASQTRPKQTQWSRQLIRLLALDCKGKCACGRRSPLARDMRGVTKRGHLSSQPRPTASNETAELGRSARTQKLVVILPGTPGITYRVSMYG